MAMYDNDLITNHSFDLNYITPYLQQAQWAELIELKKVIHQLALTLQRPISILDIGVGNARVPLELSNIPEIWNVIDKYVGTDNATSCITIANEVINKNNINNKVTIIYLDAENLHSLTQSFDMVITTWFTGGNFYPIHYNFKAIEDNWQPFNLTENKKFDAIFTNAYQLLHKGGLLVFGALYIDNDATRLKQEASYKKMGMQIITTQKDNYTATKEGFWSQRFTPLLLKKYLHFVQETDIHITHLDTYNYAMQVVVKKS